MVDANGGVPLGQARRVGRRSTTLASPGSKNPFPATTSTACPTARRRCAATSPPANTPPTCTTSAALLPVVDCLQLDATRCGGYTGFLRGAALAAAHDLDVSAHCAPALHAPVGAAVPNLRHVEWFADHARIEPVLAVGNPTAADGHLTTNIGPGHGLTLNPAAEKHRVASACPRPRSARRDRRRGRVGAAPTTNRIRLRNRPLADLDDILRNGEIFKKRWGCWPMQGWRERGQPSSRRNDASKSVLSCHAPAPRAIWPRRT